MIIAASEVLANHGAVSTTFRFLWLSSDDWTVVAALAQALAALGAIALLTVTWLSQRDARKAIENSRILAAQTAALAQAARSQLEVSTRPVIQVTYEAHERRLRLTNKGNGPLLSPNVEMSGKMLSLVSADEKSSSFIETAAFAVAEDAFALLNADSRPSGEVMISGWTVAGEDFRAQLDSAAFDQRAALVARTLPMKS